MDLKGFYLALFHMLLHKYQLGEANHTFRNSN